MRQQEVSLTSTYFIFEFDFSGSQRWNYNLLSEGLVYGQDYFVSE